MKNSSLVMNLLLVLGLASTASATATPKPKFNAIKPIPMCKVSQNQSACNSTALIANGATCPALDTCVFTSDAEISVAKHFPPPNGMSISDDGNNLTASITGTPDGTKDGVISILNKPFKFNVCMHANSANTTVCKPVQLAVMGPQTLTLHKSFGGTISDGVSLTCDNSSCDPGSYAFNTPVTLTARPTPGYSFKWSGACKGSALTCDVTTTKALSITGKFTFPTKYVADSPVVGMCFGVSKNACGGCDPSNEDSDCAAGDICIPMSDFSAWTDALAMAHISLKNFCKIITCVQNNPEGAAACITPYIHF